MQAPVALSLSIAAVERDTGLSKDTLRVWERRYGFPQPQRDALGERAYPLEQVERLRLIKRLLDGGHRPGRVVTLQPAALQQLAELSAAVDRRAGAGTAAADAAAPQALIALIRRHDAAGLRLVLARQLAAMGVRAFVVEVVAQLNRAVGDAWMRGELQVFEEHLYSELMQGLLHQALAALPPPGSAGPRVLLTTLPGEPHGLGLLMAQCMLALEGCASVSLGVQTPLAEIVAAAEALRVEIVALGFSGSLGTRQVRDAVAGLRRELPPSTRLWLGGPVPDLQRRPLDGVELISMLQEIPLALRQGKSAGA